MAFPLSTPGKTGRIFSARHKTRRHDIAWASIIAAIIGAGASKAQADETAKGLKNASAEQKSALMNALSGTAEYQGIGKQGALSLGELMGLEGYRTKSDVALREHLAAKPTLQSAGKVKAGATEQILGWDKAIPWLSEFAGEQGSDKASVPISGGPFGGIVGKKTGRTDKGAGLVAIYGKKKAQRGAQQAANEAAKQAEYQASLNAWEAKKAELEKQRDIELQTYDPTAALKRTPGYDYRYNTGLGTVSGALNRTGMSQSGRALKELTNYGQDFASKEYGDEFNRRLQLMTGGQSLSGLTGGWNIGQGNSLANIAAGQGQAQADYYGNLNKVAQGSLANYTYGRERQADRNARSSSYSSPSNSYVMADQQPYQQPNNWWE